MGVMHKWAAPCAHHDTGGQRGHRDSRSLGHPSCTGRATLRTTLLAQPPLSPACVAPLQWHLGAGRTWPGVRSGCPTGVGTLPPSARAPALLRQSRIWLQARANGRALQTSSDRPPAPAKSVRGGGAEPQDGDALSGGRSGTGGLHRCPPCLGSSYPLGGHRPSAHSWPAGQEEGRAWAAPGTGDKALHRTSRQDGALPHRGHGAHSVPFWVPQWHQSH